LNADFQLNRIEDPGIVTCLKYFPIVALLPCDSVDLRAVWQEYGALHRRYGNVQQLRQALATNSTLAASHSLLASLLRAATAVASKAASGARPWQLASHGADASGGASDDGGDLLGAGPQPITDDHVQSALRLAMSNLAASDDAEEYGQGADTDMDGSKEVQMGGMHMNTLEDDAATHESPGTLPVTADSGRDDLPVLLDGSALDVTGIFFGHPCSSVADLCLPSSLPRPFPSSPLCSATATKRLRFLYHPPCSCLALAVLVLPCLWRSAAPCTPQARCMLHVRLPSCTVDPKPKPLNSSSVSCYI
jgi:hypothetical protein